MARCQPGDHVVPVLNLSTTQQPGSTSKCSFFHSSPGAGHFISHSCLITLRGAHTVWCTPLLCTWGDKDTGEIIDSDYAVLPSASSALLGFSADKWQSCLQVFYNSFSVLGAVMPLVWRELIHEINKYYHSTHKLPNTGADVKREGGATWGGSWLHTELLKEAALASWWQENEFGSWSAPVTHHCHAQFLS